MLIRVSKRVPGFTAMEYTLFGEDLKIRVILALGDLQVILDKYRKTSNIRHTLLGNEIVDHSDVIGASPAGAAPTTSSFSN